MLVWADNDSFTICQDNKLPGHFVSVRAEKGRYNYFAENQSSSRNAMVSTPSA